MVGHVLLTVLYGFFATALLIVALAFTALAIFTRHERAEMRVNVMWAPVCYAGSALSFLIVWSEIYAN